MTTTPDTSAAPLQDAGTLAALKRRTLILLAILAPAILLTLFLVITQSRAMRVADLARHVIPDTLTQPTGAADGAARIWTSSDMTFSEQELQILETRDYVYRTYSDSLGAPVDLCVIFSEDNRKGTHPPDVCLEASGFRILSRTDRPVTVDNTPLVLRELVTTAPSGQYIYFAYFYKCGDIFTPSFYIQQVQIIWNGLTRRNASGALVRYSSPMPRLTDLDAARARTDQLISVTFPYIRDGLNIQR